MPRYFVQRRKPRRVRAYDDFWSDDIARPATVEVCDHEAVDTGLVDERGDPILRGPNPIGFIW